jgi:hypothetical protein
LLLEKNVLKKSGKKGKKIWEQKSSREQKSSGE